MFVHPFLMDGSLWAAVADHLAEHGIRSFAPDWPLGAHRTPLGPDADMSPRGVALLIASFLDALDLNDVTLVGADTGGALCQFVLDSDSSRVGRVVFSNCDAFDSFPPFPFNVIFRMLRGRVRMRANLQPMRLRLFRRSPLGFGLLANELDPTLTKAWVSPCLESAEIRDEAVRFLIAAKPKELLDVSTRLSNFDGRSWWCGEPQIVPTDPNSADAYRRRSATPNWSKFQALRHSSPSTPPRRTPWRS